MKDLIRDVCPPLLLRSVRRMRMARMRSFSKGEIDAGQQDLELYWNPQMAKTLETWGEGNTWHEIQFLMVTLSGKVLDIACGTGKTMEILSQFPKLDIYGCDISDFLIRKAIERGIREDHVIVGDATQMDYPNNFFDYSYSIGSLEHFTENGIVQFVAECYRVTQKTSFHQIPVARSGKNEGWMKTVQSFHNNSVDWWLDKFRTAYSSVIVLDSIWQDDISVGKWFVCSK